jgi:hypothetical protein
MEGYQIGVDIGIGRDIAIEERYMRPTKEFPLGSYLRLVDGKAEIATGVYEAEYPGHPSPYWHGGPPFVVYETGDWPWENLNRSVTSHEDS